MIRLTSYPPSSLPSSTVTVTATATARGHGVTDNHPPSDPAMGRSAATYDVDNCSIDDNLNVKPTVLAVK